MVHIPSHLSSPKVGDFHLSKVPPCLGGPRVVVSDQQLRQAPDTLRHQGEAVCLAAHELPLVPARRQWHFAWEGRAQWGSRWVRGVPKDDADA